MNIDMQYLHSNQRITGGKIVNTPIDMSGNHTIINVPLPTQSTDVATKEYVDNATSNLATAVNIPLLGISPIMISNQKTGNFYIKITPASNLSGAPMLTSFIAKNDAQDNEFAQVDLINLLGKASSERLLFTWESNSNIYLSKSDVNYDGNYLVSFF